METLYCIKSCKSSILVSFLFLRVLLPFILNIISESFDNFQTNIYYFENEKIFENKLNCIKFDLNKEKVEEIIEQYFNCLNRILNAFSNDYSNYSYKFKNEPTEKINFTIYMNRLFYRETLQNEEIKNYNEKLNDDYEENYSLIKVNYNWSFHFFEIILFCFYLNFCEILNQLFEGEYNDNKIYLNIFNFLDNYEKYDFYFNFINENGAYLNISKLIKSKIYGKNFKYSKFKEKFKARNELLKLHEYNYIDEKNEKKINILKIPNNYEKNEIKEINNVILLDNNKNLFYNNYKEINYYLEQFLFNSYNNKDKSMIDEYFEDLNKISNLN